MAKPTNEDVIADKLDTLIRLQARIAVNHLDTQKERILFLASVGLGPKAIGEILGTSANHANVVLVKARKDQKGSAQKAEEEKG